MQNRWNPTSSGWDFYWSRPPAPTACSTVHHKHGCQLSCGAIAYPHCPLSGCLCIITIPGTKGKLVVCVQHSLPTPPHTTQHSTLPPPRPPTIQQRCAHRHSCDTRHTMQTPHSVRMCIVSTHRTHTACSCPSCFEGTF